ncbi:MAG TPA: 23S rRNA (uracil(1939)-C(5))-methyltransferase RlmD, partial [Waddliaceae bacterium]
MNAKQPQLADLDVVSLSPKGNGLALLNQPNRALCEVEIPFAIPGDHVQVKLSRKRKGHCKGFITSILTPSPERIAPRCKHFGHCGGCRFQDMDYLHQLRWKEETVHRYFAPHLSSHVEWHPIIPCNSSWSYRNKMEFSFSSDASDNRYLGLIIDSSKGKVVNITECHLVSNWFTVALEKVRSWWKETGAQAYHPTKNSGSLRTLTLREGKKTGDRMVVLTVSGHPDYALKKTQLDLFVSTLVQTIAPSTSDASLSIFLRIQQAIPGMATQFYEMHLYGPEKMREILSITYDLSCPSLPLIFLISPAAFFQPNPMQAELLYSRAFELLQIGQDSLVYDLYCGTGTLGLCAAKKAKRVVGIEISPEAVLDARANIILNGFNNIEIINDTVSNGLNAIRSSQVYSKPDIVMV